jgi:hypothetical protein
MLPAQFTFAWTNVRPCLHRISGCFKGGEQDHNEIGEFHALLTLDSGETTRAIIPEAILAPAATTNTYLLAHIPLLMAGHEYLCSLDRPRLKFNDGGEYTMSVKRGHQIIKMLPVNADKETTHQIVYLHKREPYDPPTYINSVLFNAANRPDAKTPLAFHYHLRFGCASEVVLKQTQQHVCGMQVQKGSWKTLRSLLPCSACLAGKMRKQTHGTHARDYTDLNNLALSWTAGTDYKNVRPNEKVSVDWGIINKKAIAGQNNVFALYLDLNTGVVFAYPAQSRGLAGPSLLAYIQRYGPPETIVSDNAKEFTGGEFAEICKKQGITQERSAPYNPNQNPVEHRSEERL